jgi:hypothetical protein
MNRGPVFDMTKIYFQTFVVHLKGWSTQIWTKMCKELIFPRTFKTLYILNLHSISGIFRVLTTPKVGFFVAVWFWLLKLFYRRNIKSIFSETALNSASDGILKFNFKYKFKKNIFFQVKFNFDMWLRPLWRTTKTFNQNSLS